jgi:DNA-directed RNA polymerase specialized sigma24 family protein
MDTHEYDEEKDLLMALEKKEVKAFMRFYNEYRDDLIIFAFCLLQDAQRSNQIVDQLFERLWFEANFKRITPPIHKFLQVEIRKTCRH